MTRVLGLGAAMGLLLWTKAALVLLTTGLRGEREKTDDLPRAVWHSETFGAGAASVAARVKLEALWSRAVDGRAGAAAVEPNAMLLWLWYLFWVAGFTGELEPAREKWVALRLAADSVRALGTSAADESP